MVCVLQFKCCPPKHLSLFPRPSAQMNSNWSCPPSELSIYAQIYLLTLNNTLDAPLNQQTENSGLNWYSSSSVLYVFQFLTSAHRPNLCWNTNVFTWFNTNPTQKMHIRWCPADLCCYETTPNKFYMFSQHPMTI